jgi:hypothetical protein
VLDGQVQPPWLPWFGHAWYMEHRRAHSWAASKLLGAVYSASGQSHGSICQVTVHVSTSSHPLPPPPVPPLLLLLLAAYGPSSRHIPHSAGRAHPGWRLALCPRWACNAAVTAEPHSNLAVCITAAVYAEPCCAMQCGDPTGVRGSTTGVAIRVMGTDQGGRLRSSAVWTSRACLSARPSVSG